MTKENTKDVNFKELTEHILKSYLDSTSEEDLDILELLDESMSVIGTGKQEFYRNLQEFSKAFLFDVEQRENIQFKWKDFEIQEQKIDEDHVLVFGSVLILGKFKNGATCIRMDSRYTILYGFIDGLWRVVHIHHSVPDKEQMQDEEFPRTLGQQIEESQNMIAALTADYMNVYVIEPETNQGMALKLDGSLVDDINKFEKDFPYSEMILRYANQCVCDEDRAEFLQIVLPEALIQSFADGRERLELNFRVPVEGKMEHNGGVYIRVSKKSEPLKLIAGFRSTEDIITLQSKTRSEGMNSAYASLSDLYLAMFRINIKENTYESIKTTDAVIKSTLPNSKRYDENMKSIITKLSEAESLASVLEFLDLNTIEQRMQGKKHLVTQFNSKNAGLCKLHLIREQTDYEGHLNYVILAVEMLEDGDYQTAFEALARGYQNVFLINTEDFTAKLLKLNGYNKLEIDKEKNKQYDYQTLLKEYIANRVYPEDQEMLYNQMNIHHLMEIFEQRKECAGNFRVLVDGEIHHYQYSITRPQLGKNIVCGFQNIDAIIAEHQEMERVEREKEAAHQKEIAESYEKLDEMHDIFSASKMGTWNIYFKDGQEPRMEADDMMLELLGIRDQHLSSEDVYNAWFSNIVPESVPSVLDSVEKMKTKGRDENTYLWYHPVLKERYVRCGGTAKAIEGGYVLRGYHYDVDDLIREQKKKDQAINEQVAIIDTLSKNFKIVFVANLNTGMAKVVRLADDYDLKAVLSVFKKEFSYDSVIKQWIQQNVYSDDKKRITDAFSYENIRKVFSEQDEYSGTYRSIENGILHHYQFDFRKADDVGNVVAGFQLIDSIVEEHEQQAKREKALEDARLKGEREHAEVVNSLSTIYSTIFVADLDTSQYSILTSVPLMGEVAEKKGNFNDVKEKVLQSFMEPEYMDSMSEFLDLNTLAERLSHMNTITTDYKAPTGQWMQSRFIVKRRDENGKAKEVLYVAHDITEEKMHDLEQQKALKDALAAAQQANKAKTTFLNSMSHDIRTPMNAIIGFTALAQAHMDDQTQMQDYLKKISTSSTHLLNLINDILDMSRIESGTVKLVETEVHIPNLLHDLRTMIQSLINSKNQNLFIDTQDVIHEDVLTDKLRLNQVLLNIVGNAIKFTQPGGNIMIRLLEKPCSLKGYITYVFSVKDNGMGMSKDFLDHIFEVFSREYSATVSGIQGTGLGMAITKNIVDMMGGDIQVESEEGKGSLFTVTLNLRPIDKVIKNEPISTLLGAKALIVDDDMDTCRNLSKMLRDIQMRPDWTTSGKEAIVRAQDATEMMDEYKVYIVDYLMPDMNGIETIRRIKKVIHEDVSIIVLTAYDWADFENEAREAGVKAFVSKPIFMSELRSVLTQPVSHIIGENEEKRIYDYSDKRVLLVEDNALNREIATAILEETGMTVDSVNDGDLAVSTIANAPSDKYDVIFMDIQMPKMDGYTATREIRTLPDNRKANIPIFAMTANAFDEDKRKSYESGMDGHIIKPISIEAIAKVLDDLFVEKK